MADWINAVPDSIDGKQTVPLNLWKLIQKNIPVQMGMVTTIAGGVVVALDAAFAAEIALTGIDSYRVLLTKQSFMEGGGEVVAEDADKSTTQFKITNKGSEYGENVFYVVFWT